MRRERSNFRSARLQIGWLRWQYVYLELFCDTWRQTISLAKQMAKTRFDRHCCKRQTVAAYTIAWICVIYIFIMPKGSTVYTHPKAYKAHQYRKTMKAYKYKKIRTSLFKKLTIRRILSEKSRLLSYAKTMYLENIFWMPLFNDYILYIR